MSERRPPSGVLVVDKPRGPTSHDVVGDARRLLGTRAVGHAGTLDPMATGVLVLLVGEATRLAAYLTLDAKRYVATVRFGVATDSLDAEGRVVEERPVPEGTLAPERLAAALCEERERTSQVPPAHSAVRVEGRRAYALARKGKEVSLPARTVSVERLELVGASLESSTPELVLSLTVSKGYFVRSLARDIAERLGVPAHLSALRRVASGPFTEDEALPWPAPLPPPLPSLLSLEAVVRRCFYCETLTEEGERRARMGQVLGPAHFASGPRAFAPGDAASEAEPAAEPFAPERPAAWLAPDGRLVALGDARPDSAGGYRVVRGFPPGAA